MTKSARMIRESDAVTKRLEGGSGGTATARRKALEARLLDTDGEVPLGVGRSVVPTEPVLTGVAIVRYVTLMVCMGVLAVGGALGLGWGLVPALLLFGIGSLVVLILVTLIETRQVVAVLNSVLDYVLMAANLQDTQELRRLLLERTLDMEETSLRHGQMLERQGFWVNNQRQVLEMAKGTSSEESAKRALVASVATDGGLVDTMIEDYLAQSMRSFAVTLLDETEEGRKVSVDETTGKVLVAVPWGAKASAMGENEKEMARSILNVIAKSGPPLLLEDEGEWFFNLDCYPRPIDVIRAFDTVYGAQL